MWEQQRRLRATKTEQGIKQSMDRRHKKEKNFARKKRVTNPFTMGLLCVVLQTQVYYARSIAATKSFNAPAARVQQHITVLGNWVTLEPHNHSATGHSPSKPPQGRRKFSKKPLKRRDMTRLGGTRNEGEWPSGLRQGQWRRNHVLCYSSNQ